MTKLNRLTFLALIGAVLFLTIGLAAPLLLLEPTDPPTSPLSTAIPTATLEHCVDLNPANGNQLEHLPGIGPTLAWRIAEHIAVNGPFESVDDLTQVDGISAETVNGLRHLVCEELAQE